MWACSSCSSGKRGETKGARANYTLITCYIIPVGSTCVKSRSWLAVAGTAPPSGAGQVDTVGGTHRLPWRRTLWTRWDTHTQTNKEFCESMCVVVDDRCVCAQVLLKAERRKGRRGQIVVDDVTLRQGACRWHHCDTRTPSHGLKGARCFLNIYKITSTVFTWISFFIYQTSPPEDF